MQSGRDADRGWWRWIAPPLFIGHFLVVTLTSGFGVEFLVVDGFMLALVLSGPKGRSFALLGLPVWVAGITYANLLPLLLPWRGPIHVGDLYRAELHYFGIPGPHGRETLCQFFQAHHWPAVDVLCGFVYMCYLPEMFPFAIYLFFKDRRRLGKLAWIWAVVHIANFVTYMLYPAAPPWYVEKYGLGPAILGVPADAAGFARFDQIMGTSAVAWFYAHNASVFGAMPSGHVGSAMLFALVAWGMGWRWFAGAATFAAIMAFGAVYFGHHYVLDVLCGCLYATLGFTLVTCVEALCLGKAARPFCPARSSLGEVSC